MSVSSIIQPQVRPWERPFWKPTRGKEGVFAYIVLIHALAITGLVLFPLPGWKVLGLAVLLTAMGGLGTTVCYHRLLAHRTLKLNKVIEHLLIFGAMFNGSGAPASWVAYHRHHHSCTIRPTTFRAPSREGSGGRTCAGSTSPFRPTRRSGARI